MLHRLLLVRFAYIFKTKMKHNKLTLNKTGGIGVSSGQRGLKRDRITDGDASSDDDNSSLEESVEEHKQPQTEEIMNAELVAQVIGFVKVNKTFSICIYILGNCPESSLCCHD